MRALLPVLAALALVGPQSPAMRTVYVTAAPEGSAIAALSAADLVVREHGRERRVQRVEPSRSRLQVAIAVEEVLAPDDEVRKAVANFIDLVRESGDLALYLVGRRPEKRAGYTSEVRPFANAINRLPVRSVEPGDLVAGLHEIARDQRSREGRRAVVAVAIETAQVSSVTAEAVLDQLAASRTVLYAATLAGYETSTVPSGSTSSGRRLDLEGQVAGLERDRVFNTGTRQSGGLHLSSLRTAGLWTSLARIAMELRHQYVVTYESDSPPDGTLAIEAVRPGIVVRGPTRVR